jgi:hypothetical protein
MSDRSLLTQELTLKMYSGTQKLFGESDIVDGNEGLQLPVAPIVNRAGEDFLAGAALTQEQDRGLAAGGLLCFIYGLNHESILPGDEPIASAELLGEKFHFGLELRSFQRFLDHQSEVLGIEGLVMKSLAPAFTASTVRSMVP